MMNKLHKIESPSDALPAPVARADEENRPISEAVEQPIRDVSEPDLGNAFDEDRTLLVADETTARQAQGGKPTWAVQVMGDDGLFNPVIGADGRPMRWRPDPDKHAAEINDNKLNDNKPGDEFPVDGAGDDILDDERADDVLLGGADGDVPGDSDTEAGADLGDEVLGIEVSKYDAKKLHQIEVNLNAQGKSLTKEQAIEYGKIILSIIPGPANAISAWDAYVSFMAAKKAVEDGDYSEAAIQAAYTAVNAIGAIPVGGTPVAWVKAIARGLSKGRTVAPKLGRAAAQWAKKNTAKGRAARKGKDRYLKTNDGREFVQRVDGKIDFGRIDAKTAKEVGMRKGAPVRIESGHHDFTNGKGFGDVHLDANHGDEIRTIVDENGKQVFTDVADYVSYVANNWTEVRKAKDGSVFMIVRDPRKVLPRQSQQSLVVKLTESQGGAFYTVQSVGPRRNSSLTDVSGKKPFKK